MKPLKIAVCLSGQSRNWQIALPYLRNFFDTNTHEIFYFGHSWDRNDWKKPGHVTNWQHPVREQVDPIKLYAELSDAIEFKTLKIDKQIDPENKYLYDRYRFLTTWVGMFKSAAMAMHFKDQYEIENDMQFDLVFKTRFDLAYDPNSKVDYFVPNVIHPDGIYVERGNFNGEFRLATINDIAYFGSSRAMSIVDSFYFYYNSGKFLEMMKYTDQNRAYDLVGPNVLLHKWITLKNIKMLDAPHPNHILRPIPIRQFVLDTDFPHKFETIKKAYTEQ